MRLDNVSYKCPECGNTERFYYSARMMGVVTGDGKFIKQPEPFDHNPGVWMSCYVCDCDGPEETFDKETQP